MRTAVADNLGPIGLRAGDPSADRAFMTHAGALLFGAGGSLVLLAILLPHARAVDERGIAITAAGAYLVCLALLSRPQGFGLNAIQLANAAGAALVTSCIYFSHSRTSPYVLLYMWVGLYAFYFFPLRRALVQAALVAVTYASVSAGREDLWWWALVVGTVLVIGLLVWVLRGRTARLIEELHAASRTDPLTGLLNRRGVREALDVELERAVERSERLVLALGDLDCLKELNAKGGHQAGDDALVTVAGVLRSNAGTPDTPGRIGGDEFALILPGTDGSEACAAVEPHREAVNRALSGARRLSMSFGVAVFPDHAATASALFRAADRALAAAKGLGGNQSVLYDEGVDALVDSASSQPHGDQYVASVLELAEAIDLRYYGNARHSETVARYAELMARELGFSDSRVARIRLAGLLHDVGKVSVPAEIVMKPSGPSEEEWVHLRCHPSHGARILEHSALDDVRGWVLAHHERPDGSGYPFGLAGEEIPLEARILAVADAYEAMTSDRPYRQAMTGEMARAELRSKAGSQFDEQVVEAFLRALDRTVRAVVAVGSR